MTNDTLLMLAFGVISALGGLVMFFGDEPDEARLRGVPVVKGDRLEPGQHAKVMGTLKAAHLLTTPLGDPCVYVRVVAFAMEGSGRDRREVELWKHREWSDDLALNDGYALVRLDLTHAEVRATHSKELTFSLLTDRAQLPGSLSRDLPAELRDQMTRLVVERIPPNTTAVAAGFVEAHAGLVTLGGTELVLSTESDSERESRKQRQQLYGFALFVVAALLIIGAIGLPK